MSRKVSFSRKKVSLSRKVSFSRKKVSLSRKVSFSRNISRKVSFGKMIILLTFLIFSNCFRRRLIGYFKTLKLLLAEISPNLAKIGKTKITKSDKSSQIQSIIFKNLSFVEKKIKIYEQNFKKTNKSTLYEQKNTIIC